jgi:saccharopine dehydrogenase-like NADP-dependent oxidoreductase
MYAVAIVGAGKIGSAIAHLLADSGDYHLLVLDRSHKQLEKINIPGVVTDSLDVLDYEKLQGMLVNQDAVISALDYTLNVRVAHAALKEGVSYFDLTEDVESTNEVRNLADKIPEAANQIFMPQCGLAPGFISIVGYDLAQCFDELHSLHLRVGALPEYPTNRLNYNLTWSTDGLINEYCNPCTVISDGELRVARPLEGVESLSLDGVPYEAFNTSGGLGTLCETLATHIDELNYKTIRYPGHRNLMKFLLYDLKLSTDRGTLKFLLESSLPRTDDDVVITFCTATGRSDDQLVQKTDVRKIYPRMIRYKTWSAIQITTAAGVCAVLDMYLKEKIPTNGFVKHEQVDLASFLENRFGRTFAVKDKCATE